MSAYNIWNLIISTFIALGTCGATILALYFWLNDKKIKLNIRAMHADGYGNMPSIEGGYFVVNLTNVSPYPQRIEIVGLKAYKKNYLRNNCIAFLAFENTQYDELPKSIKYGESYNYVTSMNEMRKKTKSLKTEIDNLKIFVCLPTANRDVHYKLDQELKLTILDL